MNKLIAIAALLILMGCKNQMDDVVIDQCLRVELAQQCMKDLPAGPVAAHYNDWSEVVAECDNNAFGQAKRRRHSVKPECAL